ncbi:uncharacterized protein EV154DRAFT_582761 [Mucor mucedo]|uniref:uncharacterized protein n=1 Tax=Mucor mucedo TaxID=29922 RepID=UPI00221EC1C1|nr:uncharacterized protein EV154DRAFT_582761 [Mucor mucedo]KAI7867345.1 hypothetical protein EV154DRAFT_582761 [Mucor mucedo]
MSRSYVTGLPRQGMRFLGGYGTEKGIFYLGRSALEPPIDLQSKTFPEADEWMDKLNSAVITDNVAALGFLQLLKTTRIAFLQEASRMNYDFSRSRITDYYLFHYPLLFTV